MSTKKLYIVLVWIVLSFIYFFHILKFKKINKEPWKSINHFPCDTPPNSLMDSTTNPKLKTLEGKRDGTRSLTRNTSRVAGHARAPGWDKDEWQTSQLFTRTFTNQTTSWLVHSWNTFGARMNNEQTWTHKIHHSLRLGGSHHLPPYSILCS